MHIGRRRFLTWTGAAVGGLTLSTPFSRIAHANPSRRFVFAYFDGGWDLLLGLDPRDPATTNPQDNEIDPAYDQLPPAYRNRGIRTAANGLRFGPAVPESLLRHADDLTIVNGIGMDTAAHEVGRRYFITGRFPRGLSAVGSSAPAEIVAAQGDGSAIPHMAAGVEAYAQEMPPYAAPFRVNSLDDLTVALTPFVDVPGGVLNAVQRFHAEGPGCETPSLGIDRGAAAAMESNRTRARRFIEDQLAAAFDLSRTDTEMTRLRELYGIAPGIGDRTSPEVLSFVAGQAVKAGISQAVSVRVARGLDTHSAWAPNHPPRLEQGFAALAALIQDLKDTPLPEDPSRSVFDETTLVAFSEFGRTPLINDLQGRDHHLGNSCLLAGAGIRTGRTVGASASVGMLPIHLNPQTAQTYERPSQSLVESGEAIVLNPSHILTTVYSLAGVSTDLLRSSVVPALLA